MLSDFLISKILEKFPFAPTDEQKLLISALATFLNSQQTDEIFLLKGYAGTGKTSIVGALIQALDSLQQKTLLLAPTGRAAKVFATYAQHSAFTIHKKIYRQHSAVDFRFDLAENMHKHTLFVVDEASMIANSGDSVFGSGRLLDDLITYVYSGEGCRLLLMGDDAQLPPVGQEESPALNINFIAGYSFQIEHFNLSQVLRQSNKSGILHNATQLRMRMANNSLEKPHFSTARFPDIKRLGGEDLIDMLQQSYSSHGEENTIVITRSNKQAAIYNQGIRAQVLQKEDELSNGDLLMIVKNNYFWAKNYDRLDFLANGDIVEIERIRRHHSLYDLRFADVSLRFIDYDICIDACLLIDALHAKTPAEMEMLNKKLFDNVSEDYADIGNRRERMKLMRENKYYNALQSKFAYAVTCHKAQGGQWDCVFIEQGRLPDELTADYFRWLYTALTRATKQVYLINFPKEMFD